MLEQEIDAAFEACRRFLVHVEQMGGPATQVFCDVDREARMSNEPLLRRFNGVECVYFLRAGISGPVKIGRASDLRSRLHTVQTGNHEPLYVLGAIPGGRELERSLHARFSRQWLRGEWFHPSRELMVFIDEKTNQVASFDDSCRC